MAHINDKIEKSGATITLFKICHIDQKYFVGFHVVEEIRGILFWDVDKW